MSRTARLDMIDLMPKHFASFFVDRRWRTTPRAVRTEYAVEVRLSDGIAPLLIRQLSLTLLRDRLSRSLQWLVNWYRFEYARLLSFLQAVATTVLNRRVREHRITTVAAQAVHWHCSTSSVELLLF